MRVAIGTSAFLREGGGIAAYAREAARLLAAAGHEVLVVTAEDGVPGQWRFPGGEQVEAWGCEVPRGEAKQREAARAAFARVASFDPDAVVSSDHAWLAGLFPALAGRRVRLAVSHYLDGPLARVAAARPGDTDWVVALSEPGRDWLLGRAGCLPEQVVVLHNTVGGRRADALARVEARAALEPLRVVFPGGGKEHKGADVVLRMLPRLLGGTDAVRLAWLGPDRFIRRFLPRRFAGEVELTGQLGREEAAERIGSAHALLLPSRGEGCPMALLEAMRAGTVPVVSDCPSAMREVVEDGRCGFVFPVGDAAGPAGAIGRLARDPGLRLGMMREALRAYDERLAPARWVARMEELLAQRRGGRGGGPARDEFRPGLVVPWHRAAPGRGGWSAGRVRERLALARHAARCAWIRATS